MRRTERTRRASLGVCLAIGALVAPAAASADITGAVYRDYDANGARAAREPGIGAVVVKAIDNTGAVVATTTTATDGSYTLVTPAGRYRVEFSGEPAGLKQGGGGLADGSSVRFADNGSVVNHGLNVPGDYCEANPQVATNCFRYGASNGAFSAESTLRTFAFNTTGVADALNSPIAATVGQIGATWGIAYQRETKSIFAGAFYKRHSGFGPGGPGAIYKIAAGPDGAFGTGDDTVGTFVDLNALFPVDNPGGADAHPATAGGDWFHDPSSYDLVGKRGLGAVKISSDGTTLYTIGLNDRTIYTMPIGLTATAPTAGQITQTPVPNPGADCPGTSVAALGPNVRPFALGMKDNVLYVGETCTGPTRADQRMFIYKANGAGFDQVLNASLNYKQGGGDMSNSVWDDAFNGNWNHTQLWLTDFTFDNDQMTIGLRDRYGDQMGNNAGNLNPVSGATYPTQAGGDILRACETATGTWLLEQNGSSQPGCTTAFTTVYGAGNGQGPGGGEFYNDAIACCHSEVASGGLAQVPGATDALSTFVDPRTNPDFVWESGVRRVSNADGSNSQGFTLTQGFGLGTGTFGKANGIGDLELLCQSAPIELGNRVWMDQNGNGVQDPSEPGIAAATVHLYDSVGNLVGTTTTDAQGHYVFSSAGPDGIPGNGDDLGNFGADGLANTADDTPGLKPSTNGVTNSYSVRLDLPVDHATGGALAGLTLTTAGATPFASASSANDSNGSSAVPGSATDIRAGITLGAPGVNDHTIDFGFVPHYSLGNRVFLDLDDSGTLNGAEVGVQGVTVQLFADANGDGVADSATPLALTTTDGTGHYVFDALDAGGYVVAIPASNFAGTGSLVGTRSSTPDELDPNDDVDQNDDGIGVANGLTTSGSILLGPAQLGNATGSEPAGETDQTTTSQPDNRSNLTIDFGFVPHYSVGNRVFFDANDDGAETAGEQPIAGVSLGLYLDANADGTPDSATPLATTTTDANGYYLFDNLDAGTYVVQVEQSHFNAGAVLEGTHSSTPDEANPNADVDLNDNGIGSAAGVTRSGPVTLGPGAVEPAGESGTGSGSVADAYSNGTVDFGFVPSYSLGNRVWLDANDNGVIDTGEAPVPGTSVSLFTDANRDGKPDSAVALATTTTDANGYYLFDDLAPGTYVVSVDAANFAAGGPLSGYRSSTPDTQASDHGDHGVGTGSSQVLSGPVTLGPGAGQPLNEPGPSRGSVSDDRSNLTIDFGFVVSPRASLGDRVWFDDDHDGRQDPGEDGVPDVTVILLDASGDEIARTKTAIDGSYRFGGLEPGTYTVRFDVSTLPAGYKVTTRDASKSTRADGSDGDPATGRTVQITLVDGQNDPDWDLGIFKPMPTGKARITLTKVASTKRATAGDVITFTITVRNKGTESAKNVTVCDALPGNMTFVARPSRARLVRGGACFSLGTLAAGQSKTVTVTVRIDRTAQTGTVVNRATATTSNANKTDAKATVQIGALDDGGKLGVTGVTG